MDAHLMHTRANTEAGHVKWIHKLKCVQTKNAFTAIRLVSAVHQPAAITVTSYCRLYVNVRTGLMDLPMLSSVPFLSLNLYPYLSLISCRLLRITG